MELVIALIALAVAGWQLKLQRDEVRANSQITSLIHVAELLTRKIEYHERIIEDMKAKRQDWKGHAARVNRELLPLLTQINSRLISCVESRLPGLDPAPFRKALRLEGE